MAANYIAPEDDDILTGEQPDMEDRSPVDPGFLLSAIQNPNVADDLDDDVLDTLGDRVGREYEIDKESRSEWEDQYDAALKLARQVSERKSYPWPGASNVKFPLLTVACTQFAARAYPAIVQGRDVVKGVVIGRDDGLPMIDPNTGAPLIDPQTGEPAWQIPPGVKRDRAARIGRHMSWQLLEEMTEWETDTDALLHAVPLVGSGFKKTYFDPAKGRNCSEYVSAEDLVVNMRARSELDAPRLTELKWFYPHEIEEKFRSGIWRQVELGPAPEGGDDSDAPHCFLEQHRRYDLDGDGYPEPYICTVHLETRKVVRIVARYDEESVHLMRGQVGRIDPIHYYTRFLFMPAFDGSFYGMGFGMLLNPISESINTTINQLLDAGTLANTQGGIINSAMSLKSGTMRFRPGEWKVMNLNATAGGNPMIPLPVREPSAVLFNLLGLLIEAGKEIANLKEVLSGDTRGANMPATTTLALIEQGMQVQNAIHKRLFRGLKSEFGKLFDLNRKYLEQEQYFRVLDDEAAVSRQDYAAQDADVVPVADPSVVTSMQRLGRAQFLAGFIEDPDFDARKIKERMLEAASIDGVEELMTDRKPGPAELAALAQLQMDQKRTDAEIRKGEAEIEKVLAEIGEIKARAIKNLADAEAAEAGIQIDLYKAQVAELTARERIIKERQSAESKGDGGGVRRVAGQSGDAGGAPVPGGLSGGPVGAPDLGMGGGGGSPGGPVGGPVQMPVPSGSGDIGA